MQTPSQVCEVLAAIALAIQADAIKGGARLPGAAFGEHDKQVGDGGFGDFDALGGEG